MGRGPISAQGSLAKKRRISDLLIPSPDYSLRVSSSLSRDGDRVQKVQGARCPRSHRRATRRGPDATLL